MGLQGNYQIIYLILTRTSIALQAYLKWREWYIDQKMDKMNKAIKRWMFQKLSAAYQSWREWYIEKIRIKKSEMIDNMLMEVSGYLVGIFSWDI